jgi:hypothetical protein
VIADRIVGLDPGVNTGFAIWSRSEKRLVSVESVGIVTAMAMVRMMHTHSSLHSVIFEDARLRTWFGKKGREALQGAGSVKRDCQIWSEFLTGLEGVPFKPVSPQSKGAKLDAAQFARVTGWAGRTNEHARDAAMLVWGLKT